MTYTFKPEKFNFIGKLLGQYILGLTITVIWPVYKILYLNQSVDVKYYYIVVVALVSTVVYELFLNRVTLIEFDNENSRINISYKKCFSKSKKEIIEFRFASLQVRTKAGWRRDNFIIYLFDIKSKVISIEGEKDGFSIGDLTDIRDLAGRLSIPITKY